MIYYVSHCMHVCPGESYILNSRSANLEENKLYFWLCANSILIVVPLLLVGPFFLFGVLDGRC